MSSGTSENLSGVWGTSSTEVFAVGAYGCIRYWNGTGWIGMTSGTTSRLSSVWGNTGNDVFAVGSGGRIIHWDGVSWTQMDSGTTEWLHSVWGNSSNDVFAAGEYGTILHWNGISWSSVWSGTTQDLFSGCRISPDEFLVVGKGGVILRSISPACEAELQPYAVVFSGLGGASNLAVSAAPGCLWEAASEASWITVTSGATGSGDGSVGYKVSMNLDPERTGSIRVAGRRFWIGQKTATQTFNDVASGHIFFPFIEAIFAAGITAGCGDDNYCPEGPVTRAQMAVFLLKAKHGPSYVPPEPTGAFTDVPTSHWAARWIEQLAAESITAGCGLAQFCPDNPVTRAQMAVFLLKAKYSSGYAPPAEAGVFADVPIGHWAGPWIERLAAEGITAGCGTGTYCPDNPVTRGQMAVFLSKTFGF